MRLIDDFLNVARELSRLSGNIAAISAEKAKQAVLAYFRLVGTWSIRILVAALAPLVVIIPCLLFHAPLGWLYGAYVVYCAILLTFEIVLLWPISWALKLIKIIPAIDDEIKSFLRWIKTVLFNGFSLAIFVTLIPVWKSPGAYPLLLLILACWLVLPACYLSEFCKRVYPTVRAIQLGLLTCLLVVHAVFPEQLKQVLWEAARKGGPIVDPFLPQRTEITDQWKTLTWFNNRGHAVVWYSGSASQGYRLWNGIGFDPDTGEELRPVVDAATKQGITAALAEQEAREMAENAARLGDVEREQKRQQAKIAAQAAEAVRQQEIREKEAGERKKLLTVSQKEVTPQWKTLVWFNNAGMPNVWYSGSVTNGYRLWTAIGFDPDTAEKLRPVSDEATKNEIVSALELRGRLENEKQALQQAAHDNDASRDNAMRRYYVGGAPPNVEVPMDGVIGVVCVDKERGRITERTLVELARSQSWHTRDNVFSPAFVGDGLFDSVFEGHVDRIKPLDINMVTRTIWLGKLVLTIEKLANNQGLTTCRGTLELRCVDAGTGSIRHSEIIEASGTAFSDATSTDQFQKHLTEKLGPMLSAWKEKGI